MLTSTEFSAPVATAERMTVLDAMRGVAVLGILLINVDALSGYAFTPAAAHVGLPLAKWDEAAWLVLAFLVEAKFYSLFSFLFGVGFAVFVQRASARGADPRKLFKRRLVGLMIIGLVHTLFIWYGDILLTYALIGFALVPFLRRDDRSVLRWAVAMLAAPIVLYALMFALAGQPPPAEGSAEVSLPPVMEAAAQKFAHGNYIAVVQGNIVFTIANVIRRLLLMFFPRVLGMFLLGFYAGRRRIFADIGAHARLLRSVTALGLSIGLPLSLLGAVWGEYAVGPPNVKGLIETVIKSIGVPALSLGYAAALCLLFNNAPRLMRALAPAGRMALTNYLMHSVAGMVIFYSFGFGLFGRVSLTMAIAGALVFFLLQIVISRWWLTRAQFGPAEWLWRMFTYRQRFTLLAKTR
jgi:uncharacterized protein